MVAPKPPEPGTQRPSRKEIETAQFIAGDRSRAPGRFTGLRNKKTGEGVGISGHPLALFSYQTLSQQDYSHFFDSYVVSTEDWAKKDFGKPNIERFGAESQEWLPTLDGLRLDEDDNRPSSAGMRLEIDDPEALRSGRASFPQKMYLEMLLPKAEPVIHLNFSWFQKPATRLPEALWLSFHPIAADPKGWMLEKTGEAISPLEVVRSGNRHMHALSKGFGYKDPTRNIFCRNDRRAGRRVRDQVPLAIFQEPA